MKRKTTLKPCPFCGSERIVINSWILEPDARQAICNDCNARGPLAGVYQTRAEAKRLWNRDGLKPFSPAVNRAMARFYNGLAEHQDKKPPHVPRCNEVIKGHLCQLAQDHAGECGPLFREESND